MKALVLTYDKYRTLTDHMLSSYQMIWPSNPFTYYVPYQNYPYTLKDKFGDQIQLILTESSIKKTALKLLKNVDDEEWVYWCIDDKYPINIDTKIVYRIKDWLLRIESPDISGIMFCVKSNMLKPKRINRSDCIEIPEIGIKMFRRLNYDYIWMHQFLRAKVLKKMFSRLPDNISQAKSMDAMLKKYKLPRTHKLYTLSESIALFGESTHRGLITKNCAKSLKKMNFAIPEDFQITEKQIIMGNKKYDENKFLWHLRNFKDKITGY